jgi:hypothetical protein
LGGTRQFSDNRDVRCVCGVWSVECAIVVDTPLVLLVRGSYGIGVNRSHAKEVVEVYGPLPWLPFPYQEDTASYSEYVLSFGRLCESCRDFQEGTAYVQSW